MHKLIKFTPKEKKIRLAWLIILIFNFIYSITISMCSYKKMIDYISSQSMVNSPYLIFAFLMLAISLMAFVLFFINYFFVYKKLGLKFLMGYLILLCLSLVYNLTQVYAKNPLINNTAVFFSTFLSLCQIAIFIMMLKINKKYQILIREKINPEVKKALNEYIKQDENYE